MLGSKGLAPLNADEGATDRQRGKVGYVEVEVSLVTYANKAPGSRQERPSEAASPSSRLRGSSVVEDMVNGAEAGNDREALALRISSRPVSTVRPCSRARRVLLTSGNTSG